MTWGFTNERAKDDIAVPISDDDGEAPRKTQGGAREQSDGSLGEDGGTAREDGTAGTWRWQGQAISSKTIDEEKKEAALAACVEQHEKLIRCMRGGFFANCNAAHAEFWECYAAHRGVRGNKLAAFFAPPSFSSKAADK